MERKSVSKKNLNALAEKISSDDEQDLWEDKELGADKKHAKKVRFIKLRLNLFLFEFPMMF